jgi:hypothetical protein
MKEFARNYHANHLGNCAQSVGAAWANAHGKDPGELFQRFASCGAGRAEGGLCGAIYAAITLHPDNQKYILDSFKKATGGFVTCKEIRAAKTIRCNDCVGTAAGIIETLERE